MVQSAQPASNGFVRVMRKVYNPLGFSKGYNAILCTTRYSADNTEIFALIAGHRVPLDRLSLRFHTCSPGVSFIPWDLLQSELKRRQRCCTRRVLLLPEKSLQDRLATFPVSARRGPRTHPQVGMMLHLFCILPATFLACFQFVPAIRHKVMLFHRMNGYVIIVLSLIGSAGAIIIAPHAFGGEFVTQSFVGMLVILTTLGFLMAWINIKLLQIDQHRAWMSEWSVPPHTKPH
jgi:uncharacterized membrane protein